MCLCEFRIIFTGKMSMIWMWKVAMKIFKIAAGVEGDFMGRRRGGVDKALSEGEERRGLGLVVHCRTSIDTTAAFA